MTNGHIQWYYVTHKHSLHAYHTTHTCTCYTQTLHTYTHQDMAPHTCTLRIHTNSLYMNTPWARWCISDCLPHCAHLGLLGLCGWARKVEEGGGWKRCWCEQTWIQQHTPVKRFLFCALESLVVVFPPGKGNVPIHCLVVDWGSATVLSPSASWVILPEESVVIG